MILDTGIIHPEGNTVGERAIDLAREVCAVLGTGTYGGWAAVVEMPFAKRRPPAGARRSVVDLPTYGVAAGVVLATTIPFVRVGQILTPPSDEWPTGWAPPVKGDRYKSARVAFANSLYGLDLVAQCGSKSKAADMADALLLAEWGASRLPDAQVIVAFDPGMNSTGFAVVSRLASPASETQPDGPKPSKSPKPGKGHPRASQPGSDNQKETA